MWIDVTLFHLSPSLLHLSSPSSLSPSLPPLPPSRQHGVSYFNPQLPHWDVRMVPIEREAKERSSVLLFVISGDTLSVASMVEVSYYLGQGRSIVLCISDIPPPSSQGSTVDIEGMKVHTHARSHCSMCVRKAQITHIIRCFVHFLHLADSASGQGLQQGACLPGKHR